MIQWPFDPSVYAGLVALALALLLLERGTAPLAWRWACLASGLFVIWGALETPLDPLGDHYLQSAHMVQHMVLMAVAPPLLLLGLTPAAVDRLGAILRPLRGILRPLPALALYTLVIVGWHIPFAYDLGLTDERVHIAEHLTFLAAGVVFWWQVIPSTSAVGGHRLPDAWKIVYLFAGTLPMMAVALSLQFSHELFYAPYASARRVNAFLTPVVDQNVAGAVMMTIDMGALVVASLVIFFRWIGRSVRSDLERVVEMERREGGGLAG
ncbi:MAG: cytochrome c oxidase assembly protein [Candidatus Dormibacterales bacterium]